LEEKKEEVAQDDKQFLCEVAEFFKVFGDANRLLLLQILMTQEKNVGELAERMDMSPSAVSHQLRILRQSGLVKYRKEGKTVYYSLDDHHVTNILEQGFVHMQHKKGEWQ